MGEEAWQEARDPESGDTYFFNRKTGDVTWEIPSGYKPSPELEAKKKEFEAWQESTDPESGDTYYYNVKTGEVSWDKPAFWLSPGAEVDTVGPQKSQRLNVPGGAPSAAASVSSALSGSSQKDESHGV